MKLDTKIKRHFAKVYPQEGCGFVLRDGSFVPTDNLMDSEKASELVAEPKAAEAAFLIDIGTYIKYSDEIDYIVHSHISTEDQYEEDTPSGADYVGQKSTAVPWRIFVFVDGKYKRDYMFGVDLDDNSKTTRSG